MVMSDEELGVDTITKRSVSYTQGGRGVHSVGMNEFRKVVQTYGFHLGIVLLRSGTFGSSENMTDLGLSFLKCSADLDLKCL